MRCFLSVTRGALFGFATVACLVPAATASARAEYCVLPVINGQPTVADRGQTARMAAHVVSLPGIDRPIIYPSYRGGAWTIDDERRFIPFGGVFPGSIIHDSFAGDRQTGSVVGISFFAGVFGFDRAENRFNEVATSSATPIHPIAVAFLARSERFIIAARIGLFTISERGVLQKKTLKPATIEGTISGMFDLPELGVSLVSTSDHALHFVFDDGRVEMVGKFSEGEFLVSAEIDQNNKELVVQLNRRTGRFNIPMEALKDLKVPREVTAGRAFWRSAPRSPTPTSLVHGTKYLHGLNATIEITRRSIHGARIGVAGGGSFVIDSKDAADFLSVFDMPSDKAALMISSTYAQVLHRGGEVEEVKGFPQLVDKKRLQIVGEINNRGVLLVAGPGLFLVTSKDCSATE